MVSGMPFEASQAMLDENIEALHRQIESLQLALFHLSGMRRNRQGNYEHLGVARPLIWDKADRYVILDADQPVPRREEAFAILRDWSFERAELNLIAVCEPHRLTEKGFCGCSLAILNKTPEAAPAPDDELICRLPTGPALSLSFLASSMGEIRPEQFAPLKPHFEDGVLPERIYVTHNVRLLKDGQERLLLRALAFGA